jgi:tetratricopeptide (TPR) repeat protein
MFGNDHPSTLVAISNMGSLLVAQSKFAEAEVLRREALEGFRRVLGDDHENTLISINNLGSMLQGQGKFAEAEPYLREALETSSRVLGKYHPTTLAALVNMGGLLEEQGKHTEAEPYFREALASNMRVLGADHINTLASVEWLSGLYSQTGRHREAAELMSAAEESARKVYAGRRAALASFLAKLGRACAASGQPKDFAAGAQRLREAHSLFTDSLGPAHQEVHDSAQALVGLYQAWHAIEPGDGHDKEAAEWHAKLELAAPKVEKEPAR